MYIYKLVYMIYKTITSTNKCSTDNWDFYLTTNVALMCINKWIYIEQFSDNTVFEMILWKAHIIPYFIKEFIFLYSLSIKLLRLSHSLNIHRFYVIDLHIFEVFRKVDEFRDFGRCHLRFPALWNFILNFIFVWEKFFISNRLKANCVVG